MKMGMEVTKQKTTSLLDQLESESENLETGSTINKEETNKTLEETLLELRASWSNRIKESAKRLREFNDLIPLQYEIYSLRQEAVDYYYYIFSVLQKQIKSYSTNYKNAFIAYKQNSTIRYSSESVINNLVEGELSQERYVIKLLESQTSFMKESIKTIDSIIFGIRNRIDIQKMTVSDIQF